MFKEYIPTRLIEANEEIRLIHKWETEVTAIKASESLRELIYRICSMEEYQVKKNAFTLTDREVEQIAIYLPLNFYSVNQKNLFLTYECRSSERTAALLFDSWLQSYDNEECNRFLVHLLSHDEYFASLLRNHHLQQAFFVNLLGSERIAFTLGKYVDGLGKQSDQPIFEDRLRYLGIKDNTVLFADCVYLYYTFCGAYAYYRIPTVRLLSIIQKYGHDYFKLFLLNFLGRLETHGLSGFHSLLDECLKRTGEVYSSSFNSFFSDVDNSLKQKYINWINIRNLESAFGYDARSVFWKKFEYLSVEEYKSSNSLVMKCPDYYIVEFLGNQMGPIYIYRKEMFEKTVRGWMNNRTNTELRKLLYDTRTIAFHRKEHHGNWQKDVKELLYRFNITHAI